MIQAAGEESLWTRSVERYHSLLRGVVRASGALSGLALVAMVLVTTLDVALRVFGLVLTGAYDLVRIAAAVTIAAGLPYTTAVKGHVAIEYFYHKLGRRGRTFTDTLIRVVVMALFLLLAWGCLDYGRSLRAKGEVSMTLQLPVFWVPFVLAVSCGLVVLITLYHMLHPGRELIRP